MIARRGKFDITAASQSRDGRKACEAYHCNGSWFCLTFEHSIT
jgi:hypothetical protein